MRKSKYLNKEFDSGWKVINVYLAANYEHSTKHNSYNYELERTTSDAKCTKKIIVSGSTLRKIAAGKLLVETIADKKGKELTNYNFL